MRRGSGGLGTAWKSKPSWYIVANDDRTVHPELQRFAVKRMGAYTYDINSSYVPMLSHPGVVLDVIRTAPNSIKAPRPRQRESWRSLDRLRPRRRQIWLIGLKDKAETLGTPTRFRTGSCRRMMSNEKVRRLRGSTDDQ
jgi:hypothetical protein